MSGPRCVLQLHACVAPVLLSDLVLCCCWCSHTLLLSLSPVAAPRSRLQSGLPQRCLHTHHLADSAQADILHWWVLRLAVTTTCLFIVLRQLFVVIWHCWILGSTCIPTEAVRRGFLSLRSLCCGTSVPARCFPGISLGNFWSV
jgi:hypothetical protein